MVFHQFQQAGNEEYQSLKKWNKCRLEAGSWNSSRRMQGSEFRYAQFFTIIEKVTVHSENLKFRYAQIFAKLAKFR